MALIKFDLIHEDQLREGLREAIKVPPDDWLNTFCPLISNEIERYLGRHLKYQSGIVEYFSPCDETYLLLDRRPVHSIEEVRFDERGGFGDLAGSFDSSTILTAGVDYYLKRDGTGVMQGTSATGTLFRKSATWGFSRHWKTGLLSSQMRPAEGTVKVTYTGGYKVTNDEATNQMPGIVASAIVQAAGIWYIHLPRPGLISSENVEGYGYSQVIGVNLGDNIFASIRGMLTSLKSRRPGAAVSSP